MKSLLFNLTSHSSLSTTSAFLSLLLFYLTIPPCHSDSPIGPNPDPKRGLVYVQNPSAPQDDNIWTQRGSPLTWYYNYQSTPTKSLENGTTQLQFVPMLWGGGSNTFVSDVRGLVGDGYNISHVLGFNEPDASTSTGGSSLSPSAAATLWQSSIQPLSALNIKLGSPAPTGSPTGLTWLQSFFTLCNNCTIDFIAFHWYGDFQGLASLLGQYTAAFPNVTEFWITEFADSDQTAEVTQEFFNETVEYFERMEVVGRYAYFGAFRSSISNVGPNAALLDKNGGLTWIGAWYLDEGEGMAASVTGGGGGMEGARWSGFMMMGMAGLVGLAVLMV